MGKNGFSHIKAGAQAQAQGERIHGETPGASVEGYIIKRDGLAFPGGSLIAQSVYR
jgi:hypothetical protein